LNTLTSGWVASFLLGAGFVVLISGARLAGHGADRSFTTLSRYVIATIYYSSGKLLLFMLLYCGVWSLDAALAHPLLDYLARSPAWLALLAAGVLVYLPPFTGLDRAFRRHARRMGGMPDEVVRLRDAICLAPRTLSRERFRELHFRLMRRGIDLGNRRGVPDETLHAQLIQAAELKCIIEQCEQDSRFSAFMRDNVFSLHRLARGFDHVMFRSSKSAEAIGRLHEVANDRSGREGGWDALGALVENQAYQDNGCELDPVIATSRMLIANRRDDMQFFIEDAAMLLARLTLSSRATERGRLKLLTSIGVRVPRVRRPRFRALISVFAVVFFAVIVSSLFVSSNFASVGEFLGVLLMVPTNFVIAVTCAVYPKQYFGFANVDVYGRQPYLFYGLAGLAATCLAFVTGLVIRLIRFQDGTAAFLDAYERLPFLLITFALTVIVAVRIQDKMGDDGRRRIPGRAADALAVAVALAVTMTIVLLLMPLTAPYSPPPPAWSPLFSGLIGAFIGFYIPARFRTDLSKRPGEAVKLPPPSENLTPLKT